MTLTVDRVTPATASSTGILQGRCMAYDPEAEDRCDAFRLSNNGGTWRPCWKCGMP